MAEYIDTSINPADYIEVWEAEDTEHGKQLVMAVDDLKCLPLADVRPVVRGRWEEISGEDFLFWRCTACKNVCYLEPPNARFCPGCGAEMEEVKS